MHNSDNNQRQSFAIVDDKQSIAYPNITAKKKVIAGRQLLVAAAKVADVYTRAIPYMSRLNVILKPMTKRKTESSSSAGRASVSGGMHSHSGRK